MVKFCPHKDFCFDTGHLLLFIVALVVVWVLYHFGKNNNEQMKILQKIVQNQDDAEVVSVHKDYSQTIRDIDYERIVNPLMPPERRNHTMTGVEDDPVLKGIMPRSFEDIFQRIEEDSQQT